MLPRRPCCGTIAYVRIRAFTRNKMLRVWSRLGPERVALERSEHGSIEIAMRVVEAEFALLEEGGKAGIGDAVELSQAAF